MNVKLMKSRASMLREEVDLVRMDPPIPGAVGRYAIKVVNEAGGAIPLLPLSNPLAD